MYYYGGYSGGYGSSGSCGRYCTSIIYLISYYNWYKSNCLIKLRENTSLFSFFMVKYIAKRKEW